MWELYFFIFLPGRSVAQRLRTAGGRAGGGRGIGSPPPAGGGRPLPQWEISPGNFFASYFASGDFWCVSVAKKVVLFAFVVDKKVDRYLSDVFYRRRPNPLSLTFK